MGIFDIFNSAFQKWSAVTRVLVSGGSTEAIWPAKRYDIFAKEAYLTNVIGYRCIDEIAKAMESVNWTLEKREADGSFEEVTNHPILDLIYKPNPEEHWGQLIYKHTAFLLISGNAYMERRFVDRGKRLKELWIHRPDRMSIKVSSVGLRVGYEYTGPTGKKVRWDVDPLTGKSDIWHSRLFSPLNDWYGDGPVDPTARELDTLTGSTEWNKNLLRNSGRPGMIFTFEGAIGEMEYDRLQKKLREKYSGVKNIGKHLIIEGKGAKVTPYGFNPQELDFIEGNRELARRICLGFGVPPMLIGIPGDNTYCLPEYTRISTPTGPKCIKDVIEGDFVFSLVEGTLKKCRVEKSGQTGRKLIYEVQTKDRVLHATDNHPVLVKRSDVLDYVSVGQLKIGDILVEVDNLPDEQVVDNNADAVHGLIDERYFKCSPVQSINALCEMDVYDISVENGHNFIADGVVVHNSNYEIALLAFWETTVFFYMRRFGHGFSHWNFDQEEKLYLRPDLDSIPALEPRRQQQWKKAETADFATVNEKRDMVGLEKYSHILSEADEPDPADKIYQNATQVPLSDEPPEEKPLSEEEEEEEEGEEEEGTGKKPVKKPIKKPKK